MSHSCSCHNEISRDGSGQLSRFLKALDPSYAPIDDRSIEEMLVFTKRYANQVRFYDVPGSIVENDTDPAKISWREFFRRDIAVLTASVATIDLEQFRKDYDEERAAVDKRPGANAFEDLFKPILGMTAKIDGWYSLAIPEYPLYAELVLAIQSNLREEMKKSLAYLEGLKFVDAKYLPQLDFSGIKNRALWGLDENITADISIYQGTEKEERIRHAALFVDDVFSSFYSFLLQFVSGSEKYMQFALEQYPAHQPHMALYIAFLRLFRLAQEQMNGITERMLDFYYRDVLHLEAKSSIPDKVHLVFELAKDVSEYNLAQSTAVNAGKDAGGKEQVYKTNTDLVINTAIVKELKNIFIEKTNLSEIKADGTTSISQVINAVYARPSANSKDGFGGKFTDPNPKWQTFGEGSAILDTSKNLCSQVEALHQLERKDQAQVGFAIATPQLVMQGGKRLVKVSIPGLSALMTKTAAGGDNTLFDIWLTGEKGWFSINSQLHADTVTNFPDSQRLSRDVLKETFETGIFNAAINNLPTTYFEDAAESAIYFYLAIAEQPVIAFDPKIHTGYDFKTVQPVLRLMIKAGVTVDRNEYKAYKADSISLRVKVGSLNHFNEAAEGQPALEFRYHFDGLKTLIIQTENGLMEAGKPFDPFTAYPARGKGFYIGSEEVFNKPLGEVSININRTQQKPDVVMNREGREDYIACVLKNRSWLNLASRDEDKYFSQDELTFNLFNKVNLDRRPVMSFSEWQQNTEKGFFQIVFRGQISDDPLERQAVAPRLEIKEISLSYDSQLARLEPGIDQLFHVYPFGVVETFVSPGEEELINVRNVPGLSKAEQLFAVLDKEKNGLLVDADNALLPQFNYLSPYAAYRGKGPQLSPAARRSGKLNAISRLLSGKSRRKCASNLLLQTNTFRDATGDKPSQYSGDIQEGLLFIGLENAKPLQSVSMLFQFAEGSAANEDDDPPPINWSYLTYNEWRPLKAENIMSDGTYGFQTTGILKIDIPADASTHNTIITDGLIWLSASVTGEADRIPQLINVFTQAVEASFEDQDNEDSHFDTALPAESISSLTTPVAQISKVAQPFSSFDGKHKEIGKEFYTRVSERLRHKGRAINAWDYEHLVLDRFPTIYKVKCITHTDTNCLCREKDDGITTEQTFHLSYNTDGVFTPESQDRINRIIAILKAHTQVTAGLTAFAPDGNTAEALARANQLKERIILAGVEQGRLTTQVLTIGEIRTIDAALSEAITSTKVVCCGPQLAPGHVLIIPIANLKNRNAANPLQPKTSRRTLLAIQDYLRVRTSPFVHVHAKNPVYEQIIVSFKVKFYAGTDKGFHMKKLNDEIVHYLTPWAFDDDSEVTFNQRIYASSIINFIEERNYVDFITDFIMGVCCHDCCPPEITPLATTITGVVKDSGDRPLVEVSITAVIDVAAPIAATTDENGSFSFIIPRGIVTLTFSLEGFATKVITAGDKKEFDITLYKYDEMFRQAKNCHDIEQVLQNSPDFPCDIVASPCTSRSILVSVPQHIIIPYEEPDQPSPCEKRTNKLALRGVLNENRIRLNTAIMQKAQTPTEDLTIENNPGKSGSVKSKPAKRPPKTKKHK